MRIGIDLDNTLICYENIFKKIAESSGLIPKGWLGDKGALRDLIRQAPDGEQVWQHLQGYVY